MDELNPVTDDGTPKPAASALAAMRGTVVAGVGILAAFILGFGGWATFATLDSAAVAPGVVSVESNRKTIQHLEGGIVSRIHVREGEVVSRGQVLVELDPTRPRAELHQLEARLHGALALAARLHAERDGLDPIAFPEELRRISDTPSASEAMNGEMRIFSARQDSLAARRGVIEQRIAQFDQEIQGLEGQIAAEATQLDVIRLERDGEQKLVDRKLTGMQRLLALRRDEAEIAGSRSRNVAAIARVRQSIGEERLKILELDTQQMNEVVGELRRTETLIGELQERLRTAGDVAARTRIVAPLDGTVVNLKVHTRGGVVASGETLMDVVPVGETLVVHARVTPDDIDSVHPGLSAQTHITAFNRRNVPPVEGRVVSVSADRLTDERSGLPYFLAVVELPGTRHPADDSLDLYPGMQAEVMIVTGSQSPMDYLIRPALRSFDRALREN